MISARAQFLGAGHYTPLADALVELAHAFGVPGNLLMEVGSGNAYYLARIVDSMPDCAGLAVDLSKYAARRAAKAHARVDSIVADVWDRLPVADEASGLTLDVFAPRQPLELHRTLHRDGRLLMVTPQTDHHIELRHVLGLLDIDPRKEARIATGFEPYFRYDSTRSLAWKVHLERADVAALVAMGPSIRHLDTEVLARRIASLPDSIAVTAAVRIQIFRRL
jgi:23S rRNA (guanine745-N1)-methyltransferase